jgi:hypothetical protein
LNDHTTTRQASLSHILSYTDSAQAVRGGVQLDLLDVANERASNTGGTFIFGAAVDPAGMSSPRRSSDICERCSACPGTGRPPFRLHVAIIDPIQRLAGIIVHPGRRATLGDRHQFAWSAVSISRNTPVAHS